MTFALFLFICISLFIESVKALAIPRPIKNSPLGAFTGHSSHITFPELAFYSISMTGKPSHDVCPSHSPSCLCQPSSSASSGHLFCRSSAVRGSWRSWKDSPVRPAVPRALLPLTDPPWLFRTGGATIRNAIRRLPPPFIMAGQGAGQIAPRRPPVRRGGPAPPVAGPPRGRRYRR